jgi:hypothetical protein
LGSNRPFAAESTNDGIWHKCMDRLLFASGYALDSGSRSYVSGLFVRLAGRGLDGAYARALVSLACRLDASHLCHQTLGAMISPFHSFLGRELL